MAANVMPSYPLLSLCIDVLTSAIGQEAVERLSSAGKKFAALFRVGGRRRKIWNINTTFRGGGVAEMLPSTLALLVGLGFDTEWLAMQGTPEFFALTKRIHNQIHGATGDGGPLGDHERVIYDTVTAQNVVQLLLSLNPGDIVVLHDPQTAGMIPFLKAAGVEVVWRCHIGVDVQNILSRKAWGFLERYITQADRVVFSRAEYVPEFIDPKKVRIIPPCIDPTSLKNREMDQQMVRSVLAAAGILESVEDAVAPVFIRGDGTLGTVTGQAVLVGPRVKEGEPLVVQISRWDRLKDMEGVMTSFEWANIGDPTGHLGAHLVLAGPSFEGVTDDPEGLGVWKECVAKWEALAPEAKAHVTLMCLPMGDAEENAWIVNALQSAATIIVQKSLMEGFGLTVSEGMWKNRAMVASGIGGILNQIENGVNGTLVDPNDYEAAGAAMRRYLTNPRLARLHGAAAQETVRARFLTSSSIENWGRLFREFAVS